MVARAGRSDVDIGRGNGPGVSAAPRSLALSGAVDQHGFWSLFASATSALPPRVDTPGEFVLSLHDASGIELFRQTVAIANAGHPPQGTWAARVPMLRRDVHAVRIRDASGSLVLDSNVHLPAGRWQR